MLAAATSSEEGNYSLSCPARSSQSFQASSGLITSQTSGLEARNKKRILFAQPQIQDQIVEVVVVMLQELVPERVVEQIVDVSQILEQNVEVIKVVLQEQRQQVRFFFFF